MSENNESPLGD